MAHDVIMPALGMAQDTGLLIAWRKAPGDAVAVGEPLFEVETDKATMEVEAAAAGFLSAVTAKAGQDVPVGQVIARIVATMAEVAADQPAASPSPAPAAPQPAPEPAPAPAPALVTAPKPVPAAKAAPQPVVADGRILASPKARRVAAEEGLDLGRLAKAGHPQPYHVADLEHLRRMPTAARATLTARVDGTALQALIRKASAADTGRVIAAFAKGAWAQQGGEALGVTLLRADGSVEDAGGALTLVDLTATRLTGYVPAEGLVLAAGLDGGAVTLTLSFDTAALPFAAAAAWLNETAARVEDPVRHLI